MKCSGAVAHERTHVGLEVQELVVLARTVEVRLATVGDVGETLLDCHDVATHLLHAVLVDALQELRAVDEDRRRQMPQSLENVPATTGRFNNGDETLLNDRLRSTHRNLCGCSVARRASSMFDKSLLRRMMLTSGSMSSIAPL